MQPLISIVVPVYKVEYFLNRCVYSLVRQTYENIEIILVDDGSPDRCYALCDEWAKRDSRIYAFHKSNGGLSDARNYGAARAKGEYISFVDSDDCVATNYIEYLYNLIVQKNAEVACCNFERFASYIIFPSKTESCIELYSGREACLRMFESAQFVIACGKLFPRKLVLENPFPINRLHEDEAAIYKIFFSMKKIAVSDLKLYGYYLNENGITHTYNKKNDEDLLMTYKERMKFYADYEEWKLYAISYHAYICQILRSIEKPTRRIMFSYLTKSIFDKKVLLKTKLKMTYYIVFGKLPKGMI